MSSDLQFTAYQASQLDGVLALFEGSFGDAEGAEEGRTITALVSTLLRTTAVDELYGFCAVDSREILAAVFFSRFTLPDATVCFMLSPMAVATRHQRQGIGQALIRFGLEQLARKDVALVVTYGDPAFYGRCGFQAVSQDQIEAPYALSQPQGWQAVSLSSEPLRSIPGSTQCVAAFRDPAYW